MRRLIGFLLTVSGFIIGSICIMTILRSPGMALFRETTLFQAMTRTTLGLMGASIAVSLVEIGRRLYSPIAAELLGRDPRAPVLFLRRFSRDHLKLQHRFSVLGFWVRRFFTGEAESLEATIVRELGRHGPGIAIARPGERVPPLGFARIWVGDGDWKETVKEHLRKSQLVVVIMDEVSDRDEGLGWEVSTILDSADPRRLILVATPGSDPKRIWRNWGQTFGAVVSGSPDVHTLYVTFAGDWSPRFHNAPQRRVDDYLRLLGRILTVDQDGSLITQDQDEGPSARDVDSLQEIGADGWFYDDGINPRCGPISEGQLKQLYARGVIGDEDLIWNEGMIQWSRFQDVFDPA